MITVVCVWVRGNVPYSIEYVTRLRSMVARHMPPDAEWQFACLTDAPRDLPPDVIGVRVPSPHGMPGWWSKIELFNPAHEALKGRVVYLDLDSIVFRSVVQIAECMSPRAFVPHAGTWKGRNGLRVVPRYNTSVMVWNAGDDKLTRIHSMWKPSVARTLWGDQDYVGLMLPNEETMPASWFPRVSDIDARPELIDEAVVVLCKKPKNHEAMFTRKWVRENWR